MTITDPRERDTRDLAAVFRLLDENQRADVLFAAARRAGADCPSWCRLAGDKPDDDGSAHDFDILYKGTRRSSSGRTTRTASETMRPADATANSEWIYLTMVAIERLTDNGPVIQPAKLQVSVERPVALTADELDELIVTLGRWRRQIGLAEQRQPLSD